MPALKSLTFTAVPAKTHDPVLARRAKLVGKLEEQRTLFQNPTYTRTVQRSVEVFDEEPAIYYCNSEARLSNTS